MTLVHGGGARHPFAPRRRILSLAVATSIMALLMALGAHAATMRSARTLYYERSSSGTLSIARIPLSGRRTSTDVVPLGDVNIFAIAVSGPDIMFTTQAGATDRGVIWRATAGGRVVRQMVGGLPAPASLVPAGRYLYWTDQRAIGRVQLDGRRPQRRFLVLPPEPGGGVADGLATDGTHLYFTRCTEHAIGRADLDGSHVGLRLIATGAGSCPQGVTVAGRYLYWTDLGAGTIGRADLTSGHVDDHWVRIHSDQGPFQVVADRAHVYWTWGGVAGSPAFTGRVDADGRRLDRRFLADSAYPLALG